LGHTQRLCTVYEISNLTFESVI